MSYGSTPRKGLHPAFYIVAAGCGGCFLLIVGICVIAYVAATNSPSVIGTQAEVLMRQKRYDEAEALWEKLAQKDPGNSVLLNQVAWCCYLDGSYRKGETFALRSVKIAPDGSNIDTLAHIYLGEKRYDEAYVQFKTALKLKPNIAESYDGLGQVYEARGDLTRAVAAYTKAYDIASGTNKTVDGLQDRLIEARKKLAQSRQTP